MLTGGPRSFQQGDGQTVAQRDARDEQQEYKLRAKYGDAWKDPRLGEALCRILNHVDREERRRIAAHGDSE